MTEELTTPEIVKMDYYIIGPWFKIVVITETELLAATTKATKQEDILQLLADGEDPGETLRVFSPMEHPLKRAPLADIQALEWYESTSRSKWQDGPMELKLYYFDQQKEKSKRFKVRFSSPEVRDEMILHIQRLFLKWEQREAPFTFWRCGVPPLLFVLLTFVIFTLRAIFHFFKFGVKIADLPGGIGEKTLAVLQIAYSRDFPLMISAVVFALGWWFVTWWRPPVRTIARPVRDITQAT